ncbi:MAG: hypothetical protein COU06_00025 [Candidatus Harrisonbacteria bacterium CG10_big_fil_rev_8_21_14_0_10_38_8]|uniref:Uncharacterized protein n=1 Tax=Candidatus Harrisonbacteria bacterium CG10_big_fil_rev_8_21_14_0_10_38_8 TaxID=1974582 RepID=A0A2M6WKW4_9BACT|nr:MAG: hypothetical protein COU06_00025 [Candidatus Harrisonbacteria bacterium CG10_big_fil_rev_8_21_14_0_10_38_8]
MVYFISIKFSFIISEIKHIEEKIHSYQSLIPWILRPSLGIALFGALSALFITGGERQVSSVNSLI